MLLKSLGKSSTFREQPRAVLEFALKAGAAAGVVVSETGTFGESVSQQGARLTRHERTGDHEWCRGQRRIQ